MLSIYPLISRNYLKFIYLINFLILCIIFYILINEKLNKKNSNINQINPENNTELIINHIKDIPIFNETFIFNIPNWINQYKISYLFNFYWLQTGGYKWHLQQMMNYKYIPSNKQIYSYNQTYIFNYINHHPEYGVIIDTSPDPFQSIFSLLPYTSSSLNDICIHLEILNTWYPCYTKSHLIYSSTNFKPLFTYALYNINITNNLLSSEYIYYNEIIYLYDYKFEIINETFFIREILPRIIRLLALVPETSRFFLPYFNSNIQYINQYIDILIQRNILNDKKRLIKYNSKKNYHAHIMYSTSCFRSDLILLHNILIENQTSIQREFILIIRTNLSDNNYNHIIEIINQFELSNNYEYLHIHEYNENIYNIEIFSQVFSKALIVIGMPSHILSHIVWCLPGTHIIEIGQKLMTTDYYEISLQLKFIYWLALTNKTNHIDINDFRNLMMKVFTYIDV